MAGAARWLCSKAKEMLGWSSCICRSIKQHPTPRETDVRRDDEMGFKYGAARGVVGAGLPPAPLLMEVFVCPACGGESLLASHSLARSRAHYPTTGA